VLLAFVLILALRRTGRVTQVCLPRMTQAAGS
jgi:hypothetical protein